MIFDTNILIRLEREIRRNDEDSAVRFFQALPATRMCITPTIAGEFACGLSMSRQRNWKEFLAPYEILPITEEVTWRYGQIYRDLASKGKLIGTNDLWIAATALAHKVPIATHNVREFSRVIGLDVMAVED